MNTFIPRVECTRNIETNKTASLSENVMKALTWAETLIATFLMAMEDKSAVEPNSPIYSAIIYRQSQEATPTFLTFPFIRLFERRIIPFRPTPYNKEILQKWILDILCTLRVFQYTTILKRYTAMWISLKSYYEKV